MPRLLSSLLGALPAILIVCLVQLTVTVQSAPGQAPATPAPGEVNITVSRIYTFVDKTGFGHQHAIEGKLVSGHLLIGSETAAGKLIFDMKSFDADTAKARRYIGLSGTTDASTRSQVNASMKGSDVLNVQQHPTATYEVTSALPTGKKSRRGLPAYRLTGTFTLHGVARPLIVDADLEQARGWLHLRGHFTINQSAFGIRPFSKAFGAIGVADALRIHGDFWVAPNDRIAMSGIPARN